MSSSDPAKEEAAAAPEPEHPHTIVESIKDGAEKFINATILSPYGNYIDGSVDVPKGKIIKEAFVDATTTGYGNYIDGHVAPPDGKIVEEAVVDATTTGYGNYIDGKVKLG